MKIQSTIICLICGAMATSCSQDELSGLPEGKYPLTITRASVNDNAQTRITETSNGSCQWNDGDNIKVRIGNSDTDGTYQLNADGTVSKSVSPCYWETMDDETITAWYSESEEIDLHDQTDGLPYVLKAETKGNYTTPITLNFAHQLAKVRVKLKDSWDSQYEISKAEVYNFQRCKNNQGNVEGTNEGWITMQKTEDNTWEANVVPTTSLPQDFILLNEEYIVKASLDFSELKAGKGYTVTIGRVGDEEEIDLSSNNGETIAIEGDGTYRISGTGKSRITISGSPTVILDNATFKNISYDNLITVTGGTPTIKLVGMNTVELYDYQLISLKNGAGVVIDGDGSGTLTTSAYRVSHGPLIGTAYDYNNAIVAGNIEIKNATLTFNVSNFYCPIIGAFSSYYNSSCGNITIENSKLNVTANGYYSSSPILGAATYSDYSSAKTSCKDINIISSTLEITESYNEYGYPFIGAKTYPYSSFENINIYLKEKDTKETFLNKLKCTESEIDNDKKIGYYENGEESESSINWYDYGKY